jgi:cytochrome c oxidase subunit 4
MTEHSHHADQGSATAAPGEHHHPTWKEYKWVALILFIITVAEVAAYYIPAFVASRAFVPSLIFMSVVKFAIVVMYYMHLKYDAKLFRALFVGPLAIAVITVIALLFLFGQISLTG